ncbi:3-dehydroquinate synthase [Planctomycetota bacterium]
MVELTVKIPVVEERSYRIEIGTGLLGRLWERLITEFPGRKPFIVTDQNLVKAGHLATLVGDRDVPCYVIDPPGEISKHIQTAVTIIEAMEKAYLGRDSVVLALGGGTVGDIAGFAAAIFKRGVPVVQIPTTTLAQADSAVGGKTGVDSSLSKNAFGAFWHSAAVYIDVETLATLDEREFRAGLVESVKHAAIADQAYFELLESQLDAILTRDSAVLAQIAMRNCQIKGRVVEIDPMEQNLRRTLNYGHTIGHAVESASQYQLLHGEAVAVGMIGAGLIEQHLELGDKDRWGRIKTVLEKLNQPVKIPPEIKPDQVFDLIKRDKKAVDRWPKFVLTNELGEVYQDNGQWAVDIKQSLVEEVLEHLY